MSHSAEHIYYTKAGKYKKGDRRKEKVIIPLFQRSHYEKLGVFPSMQNFFLYIIILKSIKCLIHLRIVLGCMKGKNKKHHWLEFRLLRWNNFLGLILSWPHFTWVTLGKSYEPAILKIGKVVKIGISALHTRLIESERKVRTTAWASLGAFLLCQ